MRRMACSSRAELVVDAAGGAGGGGGGGADAAAAVAARALVSARSAASTASTSGDELHTQPTPATRRYGAVNWSDMTRKVHVHS